MCQNSLESNAAKKARDFFTRGRSTFKAIFETIFERISLRGFFERIYGRIYPNSLNGFFQIALFNAVS
jgi:hypothetical protein